MTTETLAPKSDLAAQMADLGQRARAGARALGLLTADQRTAGLKAIAHAIRDHAGSILAANARDIEAAIANDLTKARVDRLRLDAARLEGIAAGVDAVSELDDPVGAEIARWDMPSGLDIARVRTPLGVVGVIYESRPNVTADAAALCLRSGNGVILRGGSEAVHSNTAIFEAVTAGLETSGSPSDAVQLVPTTDRAAVGEMLKGLGGTIDVIVPRGGRSLVERVENDARVPVFAHLDGICHVYVHEAADLNMAREIAVNAKMRRTGVCGAAETVLIDTAIAAQAARNIVNALTEAGCEVRGDARTRALAPTVLPASEEDWSTEYLDAIISVAVVDGLEAAAEHITRYGSSHTETIITGDDAAADRFFALVDSAIVMRNASTQFADGGEFGMGAEIGIATGRMHARGPVGAEQLTTFKYIVRGSGQTRA